jgi:predicted DNA binding CopG/RHH family protein
MSEDHRTKRIAVRFTEDDLAWLNEQAEDEGVEPATLVRMIVARLRKGRAPLVSI